MTYADELELYMLGLINQERTSRGLNQLQLETNLNQSAEDHSEWMLAANVFSHTGSGNSSATQRMVAAGFDLTGNSGTAENIAIQSARGAAGFLDDVQDLHNSLMNSSGHRANILDPKSQYIGIGIEVGSFTYDSGFTGNSVIVTQNFGRTQGSVDLDDLNGGQDPVDVVVTHVDSAVSFSMADHSQNLETLNLTGTGNIDGTGNGRANTITGNSGNNVLHGAGGNDILHGNAGNDTLNGGLGNDTMHGGAGDDRFIVNSSGDKVRENAGEGIDTVVSTVSYNLNANSQFIENLVLGNGSGINGTGNSADNVISGHGGANVLIGAAGNDILNGGLGNDTLYGGADDDRLNGGFGNDRMVGGSGNDRYFVNSSADRVVEFAGGGIDTVVSNAASFSLLANSNNIENLFLGGTGNINGNGNHANNTMAGNSGNNILNGGMGNDIIFGRAGNDTLKGGAGADILNGGGGNDVLNGGFDTDVDIFVFANGFGQDTIQAFDQGEDRINLVNVSGITDFADLDTNHVTQVGSNAVITIGSDTITILNTNIDDLVASDFVF